jgi:hypothetical protein
LIIIFDENATRVCRARRAPLPAEPRRTTNPREPPNPPEPRPPANPDRYTEAISRTGHFRASDADRDQVAERLRAAATEGRIGYDELEERLGKTLGARTYADLEAVVADLPPSPPARRRPLLPASPLARVAIVAAVAVPVVLAAIVVLTAVLSAWILWGIAGWWCLGQRHGYGRHPSRHPRHRPPYSGAPGGHRQAGAGPGRWV